MPTPTPTHSQLVTLLKTAEETGASAEIIARLQWFAHFAQTKSISQTCSQFGIARTTFYRWFKRFDPADLSTLENTTKSLLIGQQTQPCVSCAGCPLCFIFKWLRHWLKSPALYIALIFTLLNISLILFAIPQTAKASSWNPTVLANTEAFQIIDDMDVDSDIQLRFGDTLNKSLTYKRTGQFMFDDDLEVQGFFSATGIDGAGLTDCDLTNSKLLWDATTKTFSCGVDQAGGGSATLQGAYDNDPDIGNAVINLTSDDDALNIVNPASGGVDSDFIHTVEQNATGSGMLIDTASTTAPALSITTTTEGTAAAHAPHLLFGKDGAFDTNLFRDAANSLRTSGNLTIDQDLDIQGGLTGAGLVDCDGTGQKLLWNDATGTFSCGADNNLDTKPYMVIDTAGNQDIDNTERTVNLNTESLAHNNYTLSNNEITITEAGLYQVSYGFNYDITSNQGGARGRVTCHIEDNDAGSFTNSPGSYASVYHRESAGGSGMSHTFILKLDNSSRKIRLRMDRTYGSTRIDTAANQVSISIIKLD